MSRRLAPILVCLFANAAWAEGLEEKSMTQLNAEIEQVAGMVSNARADINLVEKQYSQREEPSDEAARMARHCLGVVLRRGRNRADQWWN